MKRWMIMTATLLLHTTALPQASFAFLNTMPRQIEQPYTVPLGFEEVPVQVRAGKLLIEAVMNQDTGYFIVDTGAPSLVVNRKPQAQDGNKAFSISNSFAAEPITVERLSWPGFQAKALDAYAVDLSHLERAVNLPLLGMVGHSILRDFCVFIDYTERRLFLRKRGQWPAITAGTNGHELVLHIEQELPIIERELGGERLRFILDLGTRDNILDKNLSTSAAFLPTGTARLQGLDQAKDLVESGLVSQLQLGPLTLSQEPFLLADLRQLQAVTGLQIDGILGYEFFKDFKLVIDYPTGTVLLLP